MFTVFLTIIIIGYVLYYGYLVISDLFLKKGAVTVAKTEEMDIDISDEVGQFESSFVERETNDDSRFHPIEATAQVTNTGALEVQDLLKHVDYFAENGAFGELKALQADWEVVDAA